MQRTIARGASFLCAVALLAAAATPASAAGPPPGKGLATFGTYTCDGLGEVDLVGPSGDKAASVYTTTGEHLNLLSLEITGTFEGNPVDILEDLRTEVGADDVYVHPALRGRPNDH